MSARLEELGDLFEQAYDSGNIPLARQLRDLYREEEKQQQVEIPPEVPPASMGLGSLGRLPARRKSAFSRGIDMSQRAYGSALEGLGKVLNLEGLEEYGAEVAIENEAQLQEQEEFATRLSDVKDISSAGAFLKDTILETAPQTILTGLGAAGALALTGPTGVLATLGVATVGGAPVQVPFFYGSNRERQKEAIESGDRIEMDEGAAFLASLPQAAFDTVSELILLRVGATPKAIANGLFTKAGAKEVAGIAATGAGKGVLLEAPTEIGQQMIERAQAGLSIDSEEAIDEYIEAGIAGGLVGGAIRGVADPITARRRPEAEVEVESDPSSLVKEETKKVLEGEQEVLDQLKDEKQMQLLPTTIEELEAIEKREKRKDQETEKTKTRLTEEIEIVNQKISSAVETGNKTALDAAIKEKQKIDRERDALQERTESASVTKDILGDRPDRKTIPIEEQIEKSKKEEAKEIAIRREIEDEDPEVRKKALRKAVEEEMTGIVEEQKAKSEIETFEGRAVEESKRVARKRQEALLKTIDDLVTPNYFPNINILQDKFKSNLSEKGITDLTLTGPEGERVKIIGVEPTAKEIKVLQKAIDVQRAKPMVREEQVGLEDPFTEEVKIVNQKISSAIETDDRTAFDAAVKERQEIDKKRDVLREAEEIKARLEKQKIDEAEEIKARLTGIKSPTEQQGLPFGAKEQQRKKALRRAASAVERGASETRPEIGIPQETIRQTDDRTIDLFDGNPIDPTTVVLPKPEVRLTPKPTVTPTTVAPTFRMVRSALTDVGVDNKEIQAALDIAAEEGTKQLPALENIAKKLKGKRKKDYTKALKKRMTEPAKIDLIKEKVEKIQGEDIPLTVSGVSTESKSFEGDKTAVDLAEEGNISGLLNRIADTTQDQRLAQIARALSTRMGSTRLTLGSEKELSDRAGSFNPRTNTIMINRLDGVGMNDHTVLHESTHAVTSATLANPSHPLTRQITTLFNEVKDQLSTAYGSRNVDEFVAEFYSNPEFVQELARIFAKKDGVVTTALKAMRDIIQNFLRSLVGADTKRTEARPKKLDELETAIKKIIAPAPESRNAGDLLMLSKLGITKEDQKALGDKLRKTAGAVIGEDRVEGADDLISSGLNKLNKVGKKIGLKFLPLAGLVSGLKYNYDMDMAKPFLRAVEVLGGDINRAETRLTATGDSIYKYLQKNQKEQKLFNKVVYRSTVGRVDPTKKESDYKGKKLERFKDIQKEYNKLSKDGQEAYRRLRDTYAQLYKELRDAIGTRIDETEGLSAEGKKTLKDKIFNELLNEANISPYFPLTREGDYWLRYDVRIKGIDGKITTEPAVEAFTSPSARRRAVKELEKTINSAEGLVKDSQRNLSSLDETAKSFISSPAPSNAFISEALKILTDNGVNEGTQQQFLQLFISTLPESALVRSMRFRKDRLGYKEDAMDAFTQKAYSFSRQVQAIKNAKKINKSHEELIKELDSVKTKSQPLTDRIEAGEITFDEARKQYKNYISPETVDAIKESLEEVRSFAVNPPSNWMESVATFLNKAAFLFTLGANFSSTVVNTANLAVMVLPYLSGKTDFRSAARAMGVASNLFVGSGTDRIVKLYGEDKDVTIKSARVVGNSIDNYYTPDEDGNLSLRKDLEGLDEDFYTGTLDGKTSKTHTKREFLEAIKGLVQEADDRNILNRSMFTEMANIQTTRPEQGLFSRITSFSAIPFHTAERYARQTTLVAAYLTELQRIKDKPNKAKGEQNLDANTIKINSIDEALYDTTATNGGNSITTAPPIAKENVGKTLMMYRTFGVQMYLTQFATLFKALKDADPYVKKQAQRQIAGIQGAVLLLAGVAGFTPFGMAAGAYNALKSDEDEDLETLTRIAFGEGIYKGGISALTALLGSEIDVSSRIGLANMIIGSNKYKFDETWEKTVLGNLMGPSYGVASKFKRGVNDFSEASTRGDYFRAFEGLTPTGLSNVIRSARYFDEGILTRRSDPIVDDVNPVNLGFQFLGFAPGEYTRTMETRQVMKGIDRAVQKRRTDIANDLYRAIRFNDPTKDIYDRIDKFNRDHPRFAIDRDYIKRSFKSHQKSTLNMVNGVILSPKLKADLLQIRDSLNPIEPIFR